MGARKEKKSRAWVRDQTDRSENCFWLNLPVKSTSTVYQQPQMEVTGVSSNCVHIAKEKDREMFQLLMGAEDESDRSSA